jgi:flagellar motor switch protein FliN/FliY
MEANKAGSIIQPDDTEVQLDGEQQSPKPARSIDFLFDVSLNVSVEVGRSKLLVKDLLEMREGYVIELDKMAGEPLDLYVNSRLIARGEAVLVKDKFGLRLTEVVSPTKRIESLG